jgi:hypothetical protein
MIAVLTMAEYFRDEELFDVTSGFEALTIQR